MSVSTEDQASGMTPSQTVIDLLSRQRDLYRGLHQLAQQQRKLVVGDDSSALLSLLSKRQNLTKSLLDVGRQLAPHRQDWSVTRQSLDPPSRQQVENLFAEISRLLGEIIAGDEADAKLLTARKTQAATGLKSARSDRQAAAAYSQCSQVVESRFDRISEES